MGKSLLNYGGSSELLLWDLVCGNNSFPVQLR